MKRFFEFIIKVGLILIPVFVINILYINTNYWKNENLFNKFYDVPYNIQLGNLGSSHGLYGFKYDVVPEITTYNFALSSQPYFYDLALLEKYIDHFEKDAVVIILISYFEITRRPDYSYRKRYYRILPKSKMDYWSFKENLVYHLFPFVSSDSLIPHIMKDIPKEQMGPFYDRNTYLDDEKLYEYCVEKHLSWTSPELEKGEEGFEQNIKEVSEIIELCYDHNLRPVLITSPVTDVLNDFFEKDKTFFQSFERFSKVLVEKYPDIVYLDYSRNERFSKNHELFSDGDHLNNMGAEEFTKTVISELRERKFLE